MLILLLSGAFAFECKFRFEDGTTYDLAKLSKKLPPDYTFQDNEYNYVVNVCSGTFKTCQGEPNTIASQWASPSSCKVLARATSILGNSEPEVSYLDQSNPSSGIKLTYTGGDLCSGLTERKVEIVIKCNYSKLGHLASVRETQTCKYLFEFESKYGCPITSSLEKKQPSKLFLAVPLVILVYFLVGTALNKYRLKLTWQESFPHSNLFIQLWQACKTCFESSVSKSKEGLAKLCYSGTTHYPL